MKEKRKRSGKKREGKKKVGWKKGELKWLNK